MIYAFARDRGLPHQLAAVSTSFRTPTAAIWFTGIVTFLLVVITTPLNAFAALSTGCAMYLYMSYGMPVVAGLFAEGKTWTTYGKFRLGGLSKLFAIIVAMLIAALAGFYLLEATDLNEAIRLATKIPPVQHGSIEVRPVRELDVAGFQSFTPPVSDRST